MLTLRRLTFVVPALFLLSGCAYGYASGYAPNYPPGYDDGFGRGQFVQRGDLFGGQNIASVDLFYGPLARFGRWSDTRFGYAFVPAVRQNWRPYVNGRWGDERLWISNDPWGWATDHYGRWGFDEQMGWAWVPGTQWAPSWVAWREDAQVAGWAPIPPGVNYSASIGFGNGGRFNDWNNWYGPSWVWVPRNILFRPGFGGGILPWQSGRDHWRTSQWQRYSGWNGQPGYYGWNRAGTARQGLRSGDIRQRQRFENDRDADQRPEYRRLPGQDENWQTRQRPDGNDDQFQGRPSPDGSVGQRQGRPDRQRAPDGQRLQDGQQRYQRQVQSFPDGNRPLQGDNRRQSPRDPGVTTMPVPRGGGAGAGAPTNGGGNLPNRQSPPQQTQQPQQQPQPQIQPPPQYEPQQQPVRETPARRSRARAGENQNGRPD